MAGADLQIQMMESLVEADCFSSYMNGALKTLFKLTKDEATKAALVDIIVAMDAYRKKQLQRQRHLSKDADNV